MVKQIIKEAMEKNPIGLKEAVEAELMERLQLALEAKKKSCMEEEDEHDDEDSDDEMDESFDLSELTLEELEDFMESAEFDQLDEISKKTLGSYIKKASQDMANNASNYHKKAELDGYKYQKYDRKKDTRRTKGINMATDRLTKEEASPKWKVKIGNKTYVVTAKNTFEANRKAEAKAKKEGNIGVSTGKIEKV